MDPRTTERVERWDSRPFSNGYDGLSDLADREFSGAVTAASTWLFMLNGRVVGIVDGTIEDFDSATGTTYEAPDPALPLLCSMEETGGETRAKYYTNETPLEEVDRTLSSGSFTGYIELSEGVLSGDYYAVYYGGRRMAAAYIGNAERLLTGEEAFERAADEVGIYEVIDVDVDVTDVPGSEGAVSEGAGETDDEKEVRTDAGSASTDDDVGGSTVSTPTDVDSDPDLGSGAVPPSSPSSSSSQSSHSSSSSSSSAPITDAEPEPAESTESTDSGVTGSERVTESESPVDDAVDPHSDITIDLERDLEPEGEAEGKPGTEMEPEPHAESPVENAPGGITASGEGEHTPTDDGGITSPAEEPTETTAVGTEAVSESEPETAPDHGDRTDTPPQPVDEPTGSAGGDAEPETQTDSETTRTRSSSPDPDDLEAAAEELSESGVPWSGPDNPESVAADTGTGTDTSVDAPSASSSESDSDADSDSKVATADAIDFTDTVAPDVDVDTDSDPDADADESAAELEERFKQEEQWRETRSIPSIDPDNTDESAAPKRKGRRGKRQTRDRASESRSQSGSASGTNSTSNAGQTDRSTRAHSSSQTSGRGSSGRGSDQQSQRDSDSVTQQSSKRQRTTSGTTAGRSKSPDDALESDMLEREDKIDRLTQKVDDLEQRRDELKTTVSDLEHERDQFKSENQELTETVERLESRIEELETELERLRSAEPAGTANAATGAGASTQNRGTELSAQQALAGTNLFVRYESKSQPTLEAAHDDDADATSVNSNLLLEHHTQFDEADVTVDGVPYEEFLTSTIEYQFVDWLTGTLLYEIRDTGHATSLGDLYDVIPRIDRAELHASISLEDDDTDEVPDQVSFDVVAFDKRGTPLVAANLNDSREPATREMLIDLEETASAVNANFPDLGAAMVVTSSYFEPGALEIAEQATSGGFLSRGSKLSYVNLSRKQGYHMALVESRSGGFHMNVPEL